MLRSVLSVAQTLRQHWLTYSNFMFRPQLAGLLAHPVQLQLDAQASFSPMDASFVQRESLESLWQDCLWFAVPKSKITRHKKRLKTTVQKRIPLRQNIVTDPRTGQVTLKHHMPSNWKDFLPKTPTPNDKNP
jgi:ribosomal protein L32